MPIAVGDKLGHYEILASIGAGGMGEVYRARDSKLKREVAIKVLPEGFARDAERMARFQREAEVLASLNHPNIAAIYGVEDRALVMELVKGSSPKGPLPFDEAWKIASQIATALEYAHERGIMHRDLKPANIIITSDGVVKLLDFGLAKAFSNQKEPSASPENSPTLTLGATEVGVILGTAAYMAPEQARGKRVDKRADIWAFGVVLYEMLTGRRPFRGGSTSDTLAAVLTKEPDWTQVPPKAQWLVQSCLEKEPKRRLHHIGDAWRLLANTPQAPPARGSPLPWLISAGLLFAGIVAALWLWRHGAQSVNPVPQPLIRLELDLGSSAPSSNGGANVVLTSDGARLAFTTAGPDGKTHLFTRRLDQPAATELANTEGAYAPFFSPDGQWIGFFAPGKLKKVPVNGGAVTALCDVPIGRGASWGDDGNIVLAPDVQTRLLRVPASGGGVPAPVTEFHGGEISHRWPQVLPGGKAVLFTALTAANFAAFDEANIEVLSLTNGQTKTLHRGGSYGRYLASGHLLWVRNGTAFAIPFDLDRLEVRGTPVPVLEQVTYVPTGGSAQLDVSRNGTLVYQSGQTDETRQTIHWLDATGRLESLRAKPAFYRWLRFSPDGKRLVYRVSEGSGTDLWVYDLQRGIETRLTTDAAIHNSPTWTADGRFIAYQAEGGMFLISAEGGKPRLLMEAQNTPFPESFTSDGKRLAFSVSNPLTGDLDIWTVPLEGTGEAMRAGKPEPFVQTPAHERDAAFSPDGRWLAYMSTESGSYEIYVSAFDAPTSGGGTKRQLSNGGGFNPVWSRKGGELFYRSADNRIMVVSYSIRGQSFEAEKPKAWSKGRVFLAATDIMQGFDLTPDGKRFAVLQPVEHPASQDTRHHVTLVLNFLEEHRRLLAGGK
jgi:Tol biopolymer transport system component